MKIINAIHYTFRNINFLGNNIKVDIFSKHIKLFRKNNINICYNSNIAKQYDPRKKNILLALESPAVMEYQKWLRPDMEFEAEISFANFFKLDNYLCCRDLYVNNDNFITLKTGTLFANKPKMISIVCSYKRTLEGHKLRHEIIDVHKSSIDAYGSGYHKFGNINNAFMDYKFQVVIENGKHPEYVSEKFFDCLKTQTIPIYWGGNEGVRKMGFDLNGIIFFDTIDDLSSIIKNLNQDLYQKMHSSVLYNLSRLIELRNENKMKSYLNTVMLAYMHTTDSYLGYKFNNLNMAIEST